MAIKMIGRSCALVLVIMSLKICAMESYRAKTISKQEEPLCSGKNHACFSLKGPSELPVFIMQNGLAKPIHMQVGMKAIYDFDLYRQTTPDIMRIRKQGK